MKSGNGIAKVYHNKRKDQLERAQERLRMATFRMRAFIWSGKSKTPIEAFAFVADFSEDGIGIFLNKKIKPFSYVQIAFEAEDAPVFNGQVAWCDRYALVQHFLGHESLNFRAGVKFMFASEPERQRYLAYYEEIRQRIRLLITGNVGT
jgi:hypothetical protein